MNLFVYFHMRNQQPQLEKQFSEEQLVRIYSSNPTAAEERIMLQNLQNHQGSDIPAIKTEHANRKRLREWSDFLFFACCYVGLYLCAYVTILSPLMQGLQVSDSMELGVGTLFQIIAVYLIFKALLWIIASKKVSIVRWVLFILLFVVYLMSLSVFSRIQLSFGCSPWLVLLICLLGGCWSLKANLDFFGYHKIEKRIQ